MIRHLFIAVLILGLTGLAGPAAAQELTFSKQIVDTLEEAWDEAAKLPRQPRVGGVTAAVLEKTWDNPASGAEFAARVYYPQGTGNDQIDRIFKEEAEKKLAEFDRQGQEYLSQARRSEAGPGFLFQTFVTAPVSEQYLSVVLYDSGQVGGAHGQRSYEARVYDLKSGRQLTLAELFPAEDDEDQRIPGFFVNFVNAALDKRCFELYKDSLCNPNAVALDSVKDSLKNLVLTRNGLAVIYSPYEQGPYSEGTKFVDIPKSDLLAWGLSDQLWP